MVISSWLLLLLYEVSNLAVLVTIMAVCLRPRVLSPFYYMVPVEELQAAGGLEDDASNENNNQYLLPVPRYSIRSCRLSLLINRTSYRLLNFLVT